MSDAFGVPGGPAFPVSIPGAGDNGAHGMSLLDYFAAQSLTGLLHPGWDANAVNNPKLVAEHAYLIAQAMLDRRAALDGGAGE